MADEYLDPRITPERTATATAEVAIYGEFSPDRTAALTEARTYMVICLECQNEPDDLFAAKYKLYRSRFDELLSLARIERDSASGTTRAGIVSVPWERA